MDSLRLRGSSYLDAGSSRRSDSPNYVQGAGVRFGPHRRPTIDGNEHGPREHGPLYSRPRCTANPEGGYIADR